VTFFLDGQQVGRTDVSPSTPMHLVLQTETSGQPSASADGHVQIDWITIARRDSDRPLSTSVSSTSAPTSTTSTSLGTAAGPKGDDETDDAEAVQR